MRHPQSVVDTAAVLAADVVVGPGAVVEAEAELAEGVVVESCAYVGPRVKVGPRSRIASGAILLENTWVGADCVVEAGAVIGCRGFGYVEDGGQHLPIPQVGRVVLEDGVTIGSGSCLDRATTGETRIGQKSRLGTLVQVAHNVRLGEEVEVGSHCGLAGSGTIGSRSRLGHMVGTIGHSELGEECQVEDFAGVTRTKVPAGSCLAGFPARTRAELEEIQRALSELGGRA